MNNNESEKNQKKMNRREKGEKKVGKKTIPSLHSVPQKLLTQ